MKRLLLCVVLVGCGGEDGGSNGTIDIDNLGLELGIVSCSKQFECCTDAELMEQYMGITIDGEPITTEEQCVEFANALLTSFAVATFKESLEKGRIEYDGAAAADCIAALERLTCNQYNSSELVITQLGCRPFILPKVGNGGACTQDNECTSGNCMGEKTSFGEPDVDGACEPMPTAGQECDDNCADGLYCGFDVSSPGAKVCLALKPDGTQCNLDDECESDYCDEATDTCAIEAPTCDGR